MFEAESPKAHAVRILAELDYTAGERSAKVALIAQAFREWEARGLEVLARKLEEIDTRTPTGVICEEIRRAILVRAKELRGKSIDIS